MKKTKKNNGGFSLVELIVVIAIMAILAGVVAPALIRYIEKARQSRFLNDAKTILEDANADYTTFLGGDSDEAVQTGVPTSIGKINGIDCDKIVVADADDELDLSDVETSKNKVVFYVDPESGIIIGCVYNNGRYTGYWTNSQSDWELRKN